MFKVIVLIVIGLVGLGAWSVFRVSKRSDKEFEQEAADPAQRRAAIVSLSRFRSLAYALASFFGLFGIAGAYLEQLAPRDSGLIFAVTAILLGLGHKYESDMRLLDLIDRLDNHETTPT